jgi:hypothetical protein
VEFGDIELWDIELWDIELGDIELGDSTESIAIESKASKFCFKIPFGQFSASTSFSTLSEFSTLAICGLEICNGGANLRLN